jgi:hypothetical protein
MIAYRQLYKSLFYEPVLPEEDPCNDLYLSLKHEAWIQGILGILRSLQQPLSS